MQNLQIDPVKKDYVSVNGSPVPSDRVEEAAYLALCIPQNAWLYGSPDQGSQLFTLLNLKRGRTIEQLFSAYVQDALKRQLVASGKASNSSVQNVEATRYGTSNNIQVIPSNQPLAQQLGFNSV